MDEAQWLIIDITGPAILRRRKGTDDL